MRGKLFGVSIGPGNPELMTLKAKNVLETVDVICYPVKEKGEVGVAKEVIDKQIDTSDKDVREVVFSMKPVDSAMKDSQDIAADMISEILDEGKDVALVTIGDACVYSTYMYVHKTLMKRGYDVEVVSGISSFVYGAALANVPLMMGDESLCIVPTAKSNVWRLKKALDENDNVIIMKAHGHIETIIKLLCEHDIPFDNAIMMCNLGLIDEYVGPLDVRKDTTYFTTVLVKRDSD